jgi:predicted NAD/FAD-binding protein
MSFSVRNDAEDLEYNGHTLATMFSQRKNIVRPAFYRMLADIVRFNRGVRRQKDTNQTIGNYLAQNNYSDLFRDNYLLPMISAIWSMGLADSMSFPLGFFTRFFENHGLLDLTNRPQWYTIRGGSSSYIAPLTKGFAKRIHLQAPVIRVTRKDQQVHVETQSDAAEYDEVVMACHGDEALALLANPTGSELSVLGNFLCSDNSVILHTDTALLPRYRQRWASWNYRIPPPGEEKSTVTYNMNILQRLQSRHTYLVTLNQPVAGEFVLDQYQYRHPVYSVEAIAAQQRWQEISGTDRIHYCGAYWFNGFHEDGVQSALRVARMLEGGS